MSIYLTRQEPPPLFHNQPDEARMVNMDNTGDLGHVSALWIEF